MAQSERVPEALRAKFDSICQTTDKFCEAHLDAECAQAVRYVVAALARKRPSPLLGGKEATWAAGAVHAVATVNFLFDRSQPLHTESPEIAEFFGVAMSTSQNKSKQIRDTLKMYPFSIEWTLPSELGNSPLHWMIQLDGLIVDVRDMPLEVQQVAYAKGLIPYVPGEREE